MKPSLEKRKEKEANPPVSCPGAFHIVLVPLRSLKTLLFSPVRLQHIFSLGYTQEIGICSASIQKKQNKQINKKNSIRQQQKGGTLILCQGR